MSRRRNPERAAVRIACKLVSEIRRRRLRPGTPLAAEHRMVEELGVARATVREALVEILVEPKNALVKQYKKFFEFDDVELELTDAALDAIADQALARGTGARGLRARPRGGAGRLRFDPGNRLRSLRQESRSAELGGARI